jgi:SP family general alpha glucoside:H+ symporter-like MFS transporter
MADEKTLNAQAGLPDKEVAPAHHDEEPAPLKDRAADAKQAADGEQAMTIMQAIRTYPKAIGWSILLSSTLIMEGYDLALFGNLYGNPQFNRRYGTWHEGSSRYVVSAGWQSAISNGARAGEIFGLLAAGWMADRWGYRMTTIINLFMMIGFIFVLFFAPNVEALTAGAVLCGIPWGAVSPDVLSSAESCADIFPRQFQSVTPAYASEVAPVKLRPLLTTFINMCWVIGTNFDSPRGAVSGVRRVRMPCGTTHVDQSRQLPKQL